MKIKTVIFTLLTLVIPLLIWYANTNFSDEALMKLNEEKMGFNTVPQTRGNIDVSPFMAAQKALKNQNFKKAIALFSNISNTSTEYTNAQLLMAYSYFKLKDFSNCTQLIDEIKSRSKNPVVVQKAEWLQIQVLLANEQVKDSEFTALLEKIYTDKDHIAKKEASHLNKSLNSVWRALVF